MLEARQSPGATASRGRVARLLVVLAAVLLVIASVAVVAFSFASYAGVKERLDRYASDGDADLSAERFETIVWQLRGLAAVLAALGAATYVWRGRLTRTTAGWLASLAAAAAGAAGALRAALATESRVHLGALGAISVLALLVRLEFLFQPMRYDESGTFVHYASQPLYIGWTTYTAPNNHLLNTVLVHVSTALFGDAPWAIRLPALLAGVLLVPATYLAGRLLYGRDSPLLAAALVATSSVLIEYSTNARGYTAVALIFVMLLALGTYLARSSSSAAWSAFALLAALGFFAVPTFLYAFGAVVVWLAATLAIGNPALLRTRLLPALLASAGLTALLYAPVIATSGVGALTSNSFVESRSWSEFADRLPRSLWDTLAGWHRDQPAPVWAAIALGFVLGLAFHRRLGRTRMPPALGVLVFVPPALVLQRVVPFERVWLFLVPLYLLTAAAGLVFLVRGLRARRGYRTALAAAAVAACAALAADAVASQAVYDSEDTSTFRDAPEVSRFLEAELRPGDRLLAVPPADLILEYYLGDAGFDAGRLLYRDFDARRLLAVVKPPPRGYPLREVMRWRLGPGAAGRFRPVLLRRFPHSQVYELVPQGQQR